MSQDLVLSLSATAGFCGLWFGPTHENLGALFLKTKVSHILCDPRSCRSGVRSQTHTHRLGQ